MTIHLNTKSGRTYALKNVRELSLDDLSEVVRYLPHDEFILFTLISGAEIRIRPQDIESLYEDASDD